MGCLLSILIIAMVEKAPRGTRIFTKTDSMSALTWIEKNRGNSKYAQVSFLAYSWLLIMTGYIIVGTAHIAGASEEMKPFDDLSRERIPDELDPRYAISTSKNERLINLFSVCSPVLDNDFSSPSGFTDFKTLESVVEAIRFCLSD